MSVLALHHHPDQSEIRRYGAAAIAIVLLHLALIAAALVWHKRERPAGISIPAILVDLAPAPAAPQIRTDDLEPGRQVQEAEAPPPEPPKTEMVEQLPPTPPQPEPVVAAPPKVEPKPAPTPVKPQPIREQTKKPIKKRLVEQSTAAKADRIAPEAPSPSAGASAAAAAASYRSTLMAHLLRFKRWPSGAQERGERGMAFVDFTVSRNGSVTGARLTKSSGFAALDQEAMAWIQRAQPMPSFPAEMRQAAQNYTAPLSWLGR